MRSLCFAIFLIFTSPPVYSEPVLGDQAKKVISKGKVLAFYVKEGRVDSRVYYDISYKGDIFRCTISTSNTIHEYLEDEKKFEDFTSDTYVTFICYDETPKKLGN